MDTVSEKEIVYVADNRPLIKKKASASGFTTEPLKSWGFITASISAGLRILNPSVAQIASLEKLYPSILSQIVGSTKVLVCPELSS